MRRSRFDDELARGKRSRRNPAAVHSSHTCPVNRRERIIRGVGRCGNGRCTGRKEQDQYNEAQRNVPRGSKHIRILPKVDPAGWAAMTLSLPGGIDNQKRLLCAPLTNTNSSAPRVRADEFVSRTMRGDVRFCSCRGDVRRRCSMKRQGMSQCDELPCDDGLL